jgi:hypothetical protein
VDSHRAEAIVYGSGPRGRNALWRLAERLDIPRSGRGHPADWSAVDVAAMWTLHRLPAGAEDVAHAVADAVAEWLGGGPRPVMAMYTPTTGKWAVYTEDDDIVVTDAGPVMAWFVPLTPLTMPLAQMAQKVHPRR